MKKLFPVLFLLALLCSNARAQVVIFNDSVFAQRMGDIKASVVDSLTNEPVAFASVYVIPSKDTTITNFTLTDAKGQATLDEVPLGSYVFHVEMMGYKPFVKERYFRDAEVDMGTIRLQVDENFLQAATVTDVGNPIVVKKDTVEFNASSFRVGANAMLKDLLKRMPGMEITEDGKVKFNGEEIDKLTVGGRTFFFNDQSTALNNLPAAVVDKIRVIDRDSEAARASGMQDGQREKVLDVALKKEYQEGWFGNVGVKGGTTVGSKEDEKLRDDRGMLYATNALLSAYTEKDQVTVVANAQNVDDSGVVWVMVDSDRNETSSLTAGLSTAAQLGVNVNSSRIKDVESTVSANYKYGDTVSGTKSERTTYQDDGDLVSATENQGRQFANTLRAEMEFEKEKGKVWFHVRPSFSYNDTDSFESGTSETSRAGSFVNSSDNTSHRLETGKSAGLNADITFREIGGKENRSIQLSMNGDYDVDSGTSNETSLLKMAGGTDSRAMRYDSDGSASSLQGAVKYTEPVGEKWTLSTTAQWYQEVDGKVRDAFDAAGRNDYYSSVTRSRSLTQQYDLTAQYKWGPSSWINLGGRVTGILNETYSKSFGIEDTTGKGEWNWYVSPMIRFQHTKGIDRYNISITGYSRRPSTSRMLPVLNIADPSRLSLGNVYLKPYSYISFNSNWNRNNREKFSTLFVYLYGTLNQSPITSARWYDKDGILYSIPVNARKPGVSAETILNYSTPLNEKKDLTIALSVFAEVSSSVSYQARTSLPGLDKDTFDYSSFMDSFWGNADGDRFYGGASGFGESRTVSFIPHAGFTVRYNRERWSCSAGAHTEGRIVRYSLDPSIDMNTLDTGLDVRGTYTTKHEFEFESDLSYVFYKGYAEGYGQPEWQWNAEITKSLGAFNLSVKVHDILNQTRNLTHTVTGNYEEDTYRLVMGRFVLFGVKWNFGKMNAAHSQRAQSAAMQMAW